MSLPRQAALNSAYVIDQVFGEPGPFEVMYLATNQQTQAEVVLREYFPRALVRRAQEGYHVEPCSPETRALFLFGVKQYVKVASLIGKIKHAHVNPLVDCFEANGTAYLVNARHAGLSLAAYLKQHSDTLSERAVMTLMTPILGALEAAHQHRLIHGGVAPEAIFVTEQAELLLSDFQTAHLLLAQRTRQYADVLRPGYTPPELYGPGGIPGPWTDLYAWAAMFCRLLTGRTLPAGMQRREADPLPGLLQDARVSPGLRNALMHALNLEVRDRPQSVQSFRQLLAQTSLQEEVKRAVAVAPPEGQEAAIQAPEPVQDEVTLEQSMERAERPAMPAPAEEAGTEQALPTPIEAAAAHPLPVEPEPSRMNWAELVPGNGMDEHAGDEQGPERPDEENEAEPPVAPWSPEATQSVAEAPVAEAPVAERRVVEESIAPEIHDAKRSAQQKGAAREPRRLGFGRQSAPETQPAVEPETASEQHPQMDAAQEGVDVVSAAEAAVPELSVEDPAGDGAHTSSLVEAMPGVDRPVAHAERRMRRSFPALLLTLIALVLGGGIVLFVTHLPDDAGAAEASMLRYMQLRDRGDSLFALANYSAARELYARALSVLPEDEYATHRFEEADLLQARTQDGAYAVERARGDSLYARGHYAKAVESYREALNNRPGDPIVLEKVQKGIQRMLAVSEKAERERTTLVVEDAAETVVEPMQPRALEEMPMETLAVDLDEARYRLVRRQGDSLFIRGEYEEARARFGEALAIYPGDAYAKGIIDEIGRLSTDEARERQFDARIKHGDALMERANYAEAKDAYEQALQIKPRDAVAAARIAGVNNQMAQMERKAQLYSYFREQGDKHLAEGNFEVAISRFEKALENRHEDAYVTAQLNRAKKALDLLRQNH